MENPESRSIKDIKDIVGKGTMNSCMDGIRDYYNNHISLWWLLNQEGIHQVDQGVDALQIPCILKSHGSADNHASARYYSYDRETMEYKETYYCFKCGRSYRSFDLIVQLAKDKVELEFYEVFDYINKVYKVKFPYDLLLEFDPDEFYTFETSSKDTKRNTVLEGFTTAKDIRSRKAMTPEHLKEVSDFYKSI